MPFYDPYTGQEVETEEERQRREQEQARRQELADTAVQTQEIKTYGDGTVERITKQEIAPEMQPVAPGELGFGAKLGNAVSQAGTNFVNNVKAAPENFARNLQQGVTNLQNAPANFAANVQRTVSPDQAAYTRQQESGGRANIGYHFPANAQGQRQSTAFGPYGITAPAYKDIVRQDPSLNKPITEWTQEDHDKGYNTLVGRNQARLTQLGVEPTNGALQLSHLLGPDGAARFMRTGEVSAQAAAANGGMERLKQIAQGRLQGAPSASSGAAQQTQPQGFQGQTNEFGGMEEPRQAQPVSPESMYSLATGQGQPGIRVPGMTAQAPQVDQTKAAITAYQTNQDNPMELMKLHQDTNQPEWVRSRAGLRVADLITQERNLKQAEQTLPTLNQNDLAKIATKKSDGNGVGDWLQYLLFKHVGLNDLANQKGEQLGIGHKWEGAMDAEGNNGLIKYSANGRPLEGVKNNGQAMSPEELAAFTTSSSVKGVHQSADVYKDPSGKVKGSFVLETRPGSRPIYKEVGTGRPATAAESAVLNKTGVQGTLDQQAAAQQQKLNIRLQYEPAIAAASKGAATLAEFNAMNGTNYAIAGRDSQGMPLVVDQTSGQLLMKPQAAPAGAPVAQGSAPAATAAMSPADVQRQGKVSEAQSAAFVKFENEEILPMAQAGQTISRVRKEQIKGPDGILNNPEIASLLQGSSGGEVGNILRDLITGQFKDQADLSARVASLNLNDRQKAVLYRQIGLNNQIAPLTLRANAGPGAVSDAEQKANRDANVDITRQPLYSGLSLLTKDQFLKDQQQARADFKAKNPQFTTTAEFNAAWNAEKSKVDKQYENIYAARAAYIAKHNPMDKNGKSTNPGAVVDAYKYFPVPEWNSETRSWDLGTEYSKKAARPKLNDFIR